MDNLPIIEQKWYSAKLISNGKQINFRPFNAGEQKHLMIIRENNKNNDLMLYNAAIELTQQCVKDCKVNELYIVDFEVLFYEIRRVSDGEELEFKIECKNKKCKKETAQIINLKEDLKLQNKNNFTKTINITDTIKAKFNQPRIKDVISKKEIKSDTEKTYDTMIKCLNTVIVKEEVKIRDKDFYYEDAKKFIESLPNKSFQELIEFIQNEPKLYTDKEFICENCQKSFKLDDKEIKNFLA